MLNSGLRLPRTFGNRCKDLPILAPYIRSMHSMPAYGPESVYNGPGAMAEGSYERIAFVMPETHKIYEDG